MARRGRSGSTASAGRRRLQRRRRDIRIAAAQNWQPTQQASWYVTAANTHMPANDNT
jgi:hypothetical protein